MYNHYESKYGTHRGNWSHDYILASETEDLLKDITIWKRLIFFTVGVVVLFCIGALGTALGV